MFKPPTCPNGDLLANNPSCKEKTLINYLPPGYETYIPLLTGLLTLTLIFFFLKRTTKRKEWAVIYYFFLVITLIYIILLLTSFYI